MKQITLDQATKLAIGDAARFEQEVRYQQSDWIAENARYIADVETKRADKTLYGAWPKGWKAQMKSESKARAKAFMLDRFLRQECKQLDGAIWLGNWQIIQELESADATPQKYLKKVVAKNQSLS